MRTAKEIERDQRPAHRIDNRPQQRCITCGRFCRRAPFWGHWELSCDCMDYLIDPPTLKGD